MFRPSGVLGLAIFASIPGCSPRATDAPTSTIRLERDAHPLARPELDRGRLDPAKRLANLSLVFKLSPEQLRDRDALLAAQLDPASPSYHRWLTPEQYAQRFGARPEDIAHATGWLSQQGLQVHGPSRLGTRLTFSGTVGQLERAFQTELHHYEVRGQDHFAMARPPAIPRELADVVQSVHHAHDFYPHSLMHLGAPEPEFKSGSRLGIGPADWAAILRRHPALHDGRGRRARRRNGREHRGGGHRADSARPTSTCSAAPSACRRAR